MKHLPHFLHSPEHPNLRCAGFAADNPPDLFIRQSLTATQHDQFPFLIGQVPQRAIQQRHILLLHCAFKRRGPSALDKLHLTLDCGRLKPMLLREIRKNVASDPVHPCLEQFPGLVRLAVPHHAQKNLMRQILGGRLLACQPEEEPE